ncbi:hypothetical protein [Enterococcus larvae]|uniref:hypothetical protein n=1 Tax=Enterococcus larvae TaxID=2794352 RepID=UPI003F3B2E3B
MSDYCSACEGLKEYAPNFVVNGITDKECNSLQNDTGLNPDLAPKHNNCQDMNDMLDCLVGTLQDKLPAYDVCDWKEYMDQLMTNLYNMQKALICSDCGQWKKIHEIEDILVSQDGYITVTRTYKHTVPITKFVDAGNTITPIQYSGSIGAGESYISIPVSEMDLVDTVVAQPQVVGGRVHSVTVAIQTAEKVGNNYEVNFDVYEIKSNLADSNFPYAVPINFIVVGRKKIR